MTADGKNRLTEHAMPHAQIHFASSAMLVAMLVGVGPFANMQLCAELPPELPF